MLRVRAGATFAARAALDLELGVSDIPLVLQDRRLAHDGSMAYAPDPISAVVGYEDETILVNQTPKPVLGWPRAWPRPRSRRSSRHSRRP